MTTPPDPDRVLIFDTTLRDGEQSPGISLNTAEKLEIAQQLARLGVDVVEAGFPIASPGDFEAVRAIARQVEGPIVAGLARANPADVERCWEAVRDAARPRIHTFVSTSDIHIVHQLQATREDVKGLARASVAQAKTHLDDVEFSPMDATRADVEFTAEVIAIAIEEGATTINVPDTVGYAMPDEYAAFLRRLYQLVPALSGVTLSVHCHDDLGLAVANSFAGVLAGARQVECAVNGIGERAGNASLEEIVMLLRTRQADVGLRTGAVTTEIARTSRLVSRLTGYPIQPNKAIVGRNAFAHESGIHQDGVLKERSTYEIMDARTVGLEDVESIVLGKHSGRHALRQALANLGFQVDGQALNTAFRRFKEIADKKKHVTAMDLEALVTDELREELASYTLEWFDVEAGSRRPPYATVGVRTPEGGEVSGSFTGDGPVDAIFRAINAATGLDARLREFRVDAVTGGEDALGETSVVVELQGQTAAGQGVATDILEAAGRAYVRALSNALRKARAAAESEPVDGRAPELTAP
ncbi:MAG TPA: 2-isopropylmalate synthase [Solirubrobacteraceae bacterium]|nr:2-isopropylmalate synthase [Solirubrobacteraceae bacterium]